MRRLFFAVASATLALSALHASASDVVPASRRWVERPWEIRYVLFAEEAHRLRSEIDISRRINAEQEASGKERIYLDAAALFEPTATVAVPGGGSISFVLLKFDRVGRVIGPQGALRKMSAKRSVLGDLALLRPNRTGAHPYYFADWSQGIPGDVTFSPAVCNSEDHYRYQDGWSKTDPSGNFGCREWTAQLNNREQPYIDITSYSPRGTLIGEVIGWSRFDDPPKPVIGRHGKTWLCLHECPAGAKPGVIPDIEAWTAKHGYPMPQRPSKQPLYPNADYLDDLNE